MLDKVKSLIMKGATCETQGNTEGLCECVKEAMALDGQNCELFYMLGNYYYMIQKYEQSFLCYEQAEFYCNNNDDMYEIVQMKELLKNQYRIEVKNVSIVIVSYNTKDLMELCIKSIRTTMKKGSYEIIVVDNASTDGIREWLEVQNDVQLICNDTNCGFPRGCNQGIQVAAQENDIFLLNNDTILTPNAVFWLRMGLYDAENIGTAGSVTNYASNGQKIMIENPTPEGFLKKAEMINVPMSSAYSYKTWLVGFALLIKNRVLNEIGGLDEEFSPGNYEDYDYGLRVEKAGYHNILCNNSFILHWGGQNFARDEVKLRKLIEVNKRKLANKWGKKTKQILFVTHQLSYTGAPMALMQMAKVLQGKGYTIEVISLKDGEQKYEYDKLGISTWVIADLNLNEREMNNLVGIYDAIVINTLEGAPICQYLSGKEEKVYWWIHENELLFEQINKYLEQLRFEKNIHILAAGYYVRKLIKKYIGYSADVLNICIPDRYTKEINKHDKIRFAQIGLIDGMKGQEVFLEAIMSLPQDIRQSCEFYICGSLSNANPALLDIIKRVQRIFPCIYLLDAMEQEKLYQLYDEIDCVVVPSRIESMSAVMIEGFMKGKICVCTNTTGISKYIESGVNGYVFSMGDSKALCDTITYIVQNFKNLDSVRNEGRKIYQRYFSPESFNESVDKLIIGG